MKFLINPQNRFKGRVVALVVTGCVAASLSVGAASASTSASSSSAARKCLKQHVNRISSAGARVLYSDKDFVTGDATGDKIPEGLLLYNHSYSMHLALCMKVGSQWKVTDHQTTMIEGWCCIKLFRYDGESGFVLQGTSEYGSAIYILGVHARKLVILNGA
jgi:hypothetical protein